MVLLIGSTALRSRMRSIANLVARVSGVANYLVMTLRWNCRVFLFEFAKILYRCSSVLLP